jgi:hypothetical protein
MKHPLPVDMAVRRQKIILTIVVTLLTCAAGASTAYPQAQLSPDKKNALRKFDPGDVIPEVVGTGTETRPAKGGGKKSKQAAGADAPRDNGAAPDKSAALKQQPGAKPAGAPSPSPAASGNIASTSPTPTATPALPGSTPVSVAGAPQQAASPTSSEKKPDPAQSAPLAAQSSGPPPPAAPALSTTGKGPVRGGMSLPIIFMLLGLVLFALFFVVTKLKRELRASLR